MKKNRKNAKFLLTRIAGFCIIKFPPLKAFFFRKSLPEDKQSDLEN